MSHHISLSGAESVDANCLFSFQNEDVTHTNCDRLPESRLAIGVRGMFSAQELEHAQELEQFLDSALESSGLERRPDARGQMGLFATRDLQRLQLAVPSKFILSEQSACSTQLGQALEASQFDTALGALALVMSNDKFMLHTL